MSRARGLCKNHYAKWLRANPHIVQVYNVVPAPEPVVNLFKHIAGEGKMNDRCKRILDVCAPLWWGSTRKPVLTEIEVHRLRKEREAIKQAWGDHQEWVEERRLA